MPDLLRPDEIRKKNGGNTQAKIDGGGSHIVYIGHNPQLERYRTSDPETPNIAMHESLH